MPEERTSIHNNTHSQPTEEFSDNFRLRESPIGAMSSVCSPIGGFTAAKFHNSSHQPTTRSALQFNASSRSFGSRSRKSFRIQCAEPETVTERIDLSGEIEEAEVDDNGGDGGDGGNWRSPNGGGGGGEGDEGDGDEFGPVMKYDEVLIEVERRGAVLPADMLQAAKSTGLPRLILTRYLDLQSAAWPLGFLMRYCGMLRNRMLADPSFLFKVGIEVVIDTCSTTFAELKERGKNFWSEFELYTADLLVGLVVDLALVGMLAPCARMDKQSVSSGLLGPLQHATFSLPSSVFEAERPGTRFSLQQRIATYFYKGLLYGSVGFGCGIIGQGIANMIMTAKRSIKKSEDDIPVPPLVGSAVLWGVFLAVSSNTRYQTINGLELLVEASPLAKQTPTVARAFTVGVRFANNIYGGMQFVDWAKRSGIQ